MKKRKLLIGLSSAGVLLAGFGGTVLPASADRVFEVQLALGPGRPRHRPRRQDARRGRPRRDRQRHRGRARLRARAGARADAHAALRDHAHARARPSRRRGPHAAATPPGQRGQAHGACPGRPGRAAVRAGGRPRPGQGARRRAPQGRGQAKAKAKAEKAKRGRAGPRRDAAGAPTAHRPHLLARAPRRRAPIGVPNFFIDKFRIPPFLLPIYQAAGIQYGVRWEVLAAINEIETDYGRNLNVSTAGAVGWMQFLPSTWERYGVDANDDGRKDPYNPVDAIFAAARYLKAAGADQDIRRAIFAYNHADWYVESVLLRARLIGGLPADLVGSLTGLTQGHFPVYAKASYADDLHEAGRPAQGRRRPQRGRPGRERPRRAAASASSPRPARPVVAVQDGRIVRVGTSPRLGRFVQLRDVYGNTYTYGQLKSLAARLPGAQRERKVTDSGRPARAQAAGRRPQAHRARLGGPPARRPGAPKAAATAASPASPPAARRPPRRRPRSASSRTRAARPPSRPAARTSAHAERRRAVGNKTFRSYFTQVYGLKRSDVRPQAPQGRVEGHRRARSSAASAARRPTVAPHVLFEIRPAGSRRPADRPEADPRRLEAARVDRDLPRGRQEPVLRPRRREPVHRPGPADEQGGAAAHACSQDPRIDIYGCGRRDIRAGVDRPPRPGDARVPRPRAA